MIGFERDLKEKKRYGVPTNKTVNKFEIKEFSFGFIMGVIVTILICL